MEDPKWLRLITIGLILTALVVGYFLLSGRLISNSAVNKQVQTTNAVSGAGADATPSASVLGQNAQTAPNPSPKQTPVSAYNRIASRNQSQAQALPKTGFPQVLAGIVSVGVMISGWGLLKFPK